MKVGPDPEVGHRPHPHWVRQDSARCFHRGIPIQTTFPDPPLRRRKENCRQHFRSERQSRHQSPRNRPPTVHSRAHRKS
eukprot:625790-Pyramimonas_sp.AAC.1